jgi:hypothetical protein
MYTDSRIELKEEIAMHILDRHYTKGSTTISFIGLAYQGKDIVFRFIIEYSSFRDFGP